MLTWCHGNYPKGYWILWYTQTHRYWSHSSAVTSAQAEHHHQWPFLRSPGTRRSLSNHSLILTEKDCCFCCCFLLWSEWKPFFHQETQQAASSFLKSRETKERKSCSILTTDVYLVKYGREREPIWVRQSIMMESVMGDSKKGLIFISVWYRKRHKITHTVHRKPDKGNLNCVRMLLINHIVKTQIH